MTAAMTNPASLSAAPAPASGYDVEAVRADFPILASVMHGNKPLVFLDSAASAQKPRPVLDVERDFYEREYANIHRGAYWLSEQATRRYEEARAKVRAFVNAEHDHEIVFTRGATEAINLVAAAWGRAMLREGDEIVVTCMEHHSNIVPWQMLRDEKGLVFRVAPVNDDGSLDVEGLKTLLTNRTRIVAVTHVSNVLGTVNPIREITRAAHAVGAVVMVDGCQAAPHLPIDVRALDADFYAFSGHKVYGPTGIGVLYGKQDLLDAMPPYQGGGDMIASVSFETSTWAPLPAKFEAGTPAIAQAVGLGAAIDYLTGLGLDAVSAHEHDLLDYANARLAEVPGLTPVGTAPGKASVLSFTTDWAHPHDLATLLDRYGIAVRVGHHCAEPLMHRFGISGTSRASFGLYNTRAEADALVEGLFKARAFLA